jgi:hypothetical protein
MKLFLTIAVICIVTGSLYADYKWRQWVAARKRERDHPDTAARP